MLSIHGHKAFEERAENERITDPRSEWRRDDRNEKFEKLQKSFDGRRTIAEGKLEYEKNLADGCEGVMGELGPDYDEMSTTSVKKHFLQQMERVINDKTGERAFELA